MIGLRETASDSVCPALLQSPDWNDRPNFRMASPWDADLLPPPPPPEARFRLFEKAGVEMSLKPGSAWRYSSV